VVIKIEEFTKKILDIESMTATQRMTKRKAEISLKDNFEDLEVIKSEIVS
jgi:hypothetical protein